MGKNKRRKKSLLSYTINELKQEKYEQNVRRVSEMMTELKGIISIVRPLAKQIK